MDKIEAFRNKAVVELNKWGIRIRQTKVIYGDLGEPFTIHLKEPAEKSDPVSFTTGQKAR